MEAAGSLRSPAALLIVRRGLTPARWTHRRASQVVPAHTTMMRNDWLTQRLPRSTRTRSIPALVTSVSIHGVLVALVVVGVSRGPATDARDSRPKPGIIGSADDARGSGVAGALTPPPTGPSLSPIDGARYVGRYLRPTPSQGISMIQVGLVNDGEAEPHWALIVMDGDGPVQKLVLIASDTFALQLAPRQRVVFRRLGDSISAISVRRGRDTTWAERAPSDRQPPTRPLS